MVDIHAQKIKDTAGNNLIVLPEGEFDALIKQIEEYEDTLAYDEGMAEDATSHVSLEDLLKLRKASNGTVQD